MKNTKALFVICFIFCVYSIYSQSPQNLLRVSEYTLSNGLTVWLNEDHSTPRIFGAVVVKVGARDCPDTGIAHYFEHIMFKGTDKIGTINYESEKVFLDSIATKYDELAVIKDDKQRAEIQKEINRLSIRAAEYAIPNEFSKLVSKYGGNDLNAYTSQDGTVYLNTFSPQYIEQWAELSSARFLTPVFRLFQSELETVYEEKNMYNNYLGYRAIEKLTERIMIPSQYSYPIIGSAENLKAPRLSEMKAFFEKYYVASNMGLILSGDFDPETVIPILERTFSRIPQGERPERFFTEPDFFKGKETFTVKIKIPVIKAGGLVYKSMTGFDVDYHAFNLSVGMLSNANTGYLNQLNVDGKVTFTDIVEFGYDKVGLAGILIIPKIPFQSFGKAQTLVLNEVNRIKTGDFTDEMLEGAKLKLKSHYRTSLENIDSRSQFLLSCFSNGIKWEDFLSSVAAIDTLTRADVIRVVNKYLGDDHLEVRKKYGDYPNDDISKPPYKPIVPPNKDSSSVYAESQKLLPTGEPAIRTIDFDKDVETKSIQPLVNLYVSDNPMNEIFTLNIVYGIGLLEDNRLSHLAHYMSLIGTDSLSFKEFGEALYHLGAEISFSADHSEFVISVKGFDQYFNETVKLLGDMLKNYQVDKKKLSALKDLDKMNKSMAKSATDMASALLEKVRYGDGSQYLRKVGKINVSDISELFEKVQSTECDIHYCGTNPICAVEQCIKDYLPLDKTKKASISPVEREPILYDKPVIYFLDMPKSTQSIIYSYIPVDTLGSLDERYDALLFSQYLGGGMSSVMFQEIREFRSLAYSAWANIVRPVWKNKNKGSHLYTFMSTQCDKTSGAIMILDSLQKNMSFTSNKIETTKKDIYNEIANNYPSFRNVSKEIAEYRRNGYDEDPQEYVVKYLESAGVENMKFFYERHVRNKAIVYCITGDSKKIDMKLLESFGQVIRVKKKDIFKQ
ncbi:MAG: insulinase family protein [Tannerella sp.]|jgi:predicted Zn-dependent peptidase|nr:insulinase family protein [Tannerella sp.]